jgi:ribosomal protein L31E
LAFKEMGTPKVLVKPSLNIELWKGGIRHCPRKMRVKITRKYDESEENTGEMISELEFVHVESFEGLTTQKEA